jgi:DNA invertase Pin-like site-specific DNA recombinase
MGAIYTFSCIIIYLRYSSDAQGDGNSFDRQRRGLQERLNRFNLSPDTPQEWIEDPGISAFRGKHLMSGALGKFLLRVRSGEVKNGLFICESVSRATRQGTLVLLTMLKELLDAGFSIQFLDRPEPFAKDNMPPFLVVQLSLFAELAQEESRIKSEYSKRNWDARRKNARESPGQAFTAECPRWLKVVDEAYVPIPDRVASIREVFGLARDGWGITRLVRHANKSNLPVPGNKQSWHLSLIKRLFANRALIGEFQPYQDTPVGRMPEGSPIRGFYPVVIDPDLFYSVQALRVKAAKFPKRRDGNNYNYLQGLASCECGGSWRRMNKASGGQKGYALYGCSNRQRAASDCPNMNARAFDFQFLPFACEAIPDMLANGENPFGDRRRSLESQIDDILKKKRAVMAFIEQYPDLAAEAASRLREQVAEHGKLTDDLINLNANEPPRPGFTFGEAVSVFLPAYLDLYPAETEESEDAYRARALFRARIIDSVASVWVAKDRSVLKLKLKNGAETMLQLDGDLEFCVANDELDTEDMNTLVEDRKSSLKVARHINNAKVKEPELPMKKG